VAALEWDSLPNAPAPGTVLGKLNDLRDGQVALHDVYAKTDTLGQNRFRILLLRSGPSVTAYVNRCAHFGVPLAEREEHLKVEPHVSLTCNVHYARYRWSDGVCERGECIGEALIAIPLQVDAQGTIRIALRP
jgi:nitrite reductase/ring-hydroxylating ferredoxin subunit